MMHVLEAIAIGNPITVAILTICFTLLLYLTVKSRNNARTYSYPPGPFSLPVLGTLPFLGSDIRESLRRLSKDYGYVFTVYFGSRRVIILNSYEAIKEAFVRQGNALAGRPQDLFFVKVLQEGKGVVSSQGQVWRDQRKLTHAILREFGVGSSYMEDRIRAEATHLSSEIKEHLNTPWDPAFILQAAVANVIYSVCFGKRLEYSNPYYIHYIQNMNRSFEMLGNASVLSVFPYLRHLPGDPFQINKLIASSKQRRTDVYLAKVNEAIGTYEEGIVRDFVDAYLKVMYEQEKSGNDTTLCVDELVCVIGELVGAGTETTTSTLRWALVYMLRNPDVQCKVQAEIDEVIGNETPCMKHRQSMPYTEACLHEIQRIGDIVPLGVPHSTLEDIQINGYDIPKNTMVISNLYSAHYDPKVWQDPHVFKPDRFLDADGNLHRSEKLIPFSMGKRVCVGESLARMELFLFFVIILQNFNLKLPEGATLPGQTGKIGMTHMPQQFSVLMKPRLRSNDSNKTYCGVRHTGGAKHANSRVKTVMLPHQVTRQVAVTTLGMGSSIKGGARAEC